MMHFKTRLGRAHACHKKLVAQVLELQLQLMIMNEHDDARVERLTTLAERADRVFKYARSLMKPKVSVDPGKPTIEVFEKGRIELLD